MNFESVNSMVDFPLFDGPKTRYFSWEIPGVWWLCEDFDGEKVLRIMCCEDFVRYQQVFDGELYHFFVPKNPSPHCQPDFFSGLPGSDPGWKKRLQVGHGDDLGLSEWSFQGRRMVMRLTCSVVMMVGHDDNDDNNEDFNHYNFIITPTIMMWRICEQTWRETWW